MLGLDNEFETEIFWDWDVLGVKWKTLGVKSLRDCRFFYSQLTT